MPTKDKRVKFKDIYPNRSGMDSEVPEGEWKLFVMYTPDVMMFLKVLGGLWEASKFTRRWQGTCKGWTMDLSYRGPAAVLTSTWEHWQRIVVSALSSRSEMPHDPCMIDGQKQTAESLNSDLPLSKLCASAMADTLVQIYDGRHIALYWLWKVNYSNYITAAIWQQTYYCKRMTANILRQVYYMRAQGSSQGPRVGPQGPAHKRPAHKNPRGPTRTHKGPGNPTRAQEGPQGPGGFITTYIYFFFFLYINLHIYITALQQTCYSRYIIADQQIYDSRYLMADAL